MRTRYKKRNNSGTAYPAKRLKNKRRRNSSRQYTTTTRRTPVTFDLKGKRNRYSESVDLKQKNVTFYDLKNKQ